MSDNVQNVNVIGGVASGAGAAVTTMVMRTFGWYDDRNISYP